MIAEIAWLIFAAGIIWLGHRYISELQVDVDDLLQAQLNKHAEHLAALQLRLDRQEDILDQAGKLAADVADLKDKLGNLGFALAQKPNRVGQAVR